MLKVQHQLIVQVTLIFIIEKQRSVNTAKSDKAHSLKKTDNYQYRNQGELYDEVLVQKQDIHGIKQQNFLLKSKLRQQQQTKCKKDNMIKELEMRIKNPTMKASLTKENPHLLSSLKIKKNEVQIENLKLRKELKKLQKSIRFTTISELEGEQKVYTNEVGRLKEMIGKAETASELIPIEDAEVIQARIREQDEILAGLKIEQKKLIEELSQKELEIRRYKGIAEEQKKKSEKKLINGDAKKLKGKPNPVKKSKKKTISEKELANLRKERDEARNKVIAQEKRINELESEIKEIEKSKDSNTKQTIMKSEIDSIHNKVIGITGKLKANLESKGIDINDIKSKVFEHFDNDEKVSFHELSKIFARQPCSLVPNDSLQLSEYLICSSDKDESKFDKFMEEKELSEILNKLNSILNAKIEPPKTKNQNQELENLENMTEDDLMTICQSCFAKINNKLKEQKKSIKEVFGNECFNKMVDDENTAVINSSKFVSICKDKLGVGFSPTETICFVKMLSANDNDEVIKLQDLENIIKEFESSTEDDNEKLEMNFEDLDKISLVLMFALTEYMVNSKIALYKVFGDTIYTQDIQIDTKKLKIDLINSEDFFNTLNGIGISMEEKEHENLKTFLCIDPEYPDKLVVKKLKRTVEEFATNEKLRTNAYKCYQELADEKDEDEVEDEENGDSKKTI